jgi:DNA invertase Pin-like site-specific DNA recombinase
MQALQDARCDIIYDEKITSQNPHRPKLEICLAELKAGDTLVVYKLDRLGRKTIELLALVEDLGKRGIDFVCTTQGLDTRTPLGKLMLGVLASFAEFERNTIVERTNGGLAAARAKGHFGGARPKLNAETIERLCEAYENRPINLATGRRMNNKELAKMFGIDKSTLERYAVHGGLPRTAKLRAEFLAKDGALEQLEAKIKDPLWGRNLDK